MSKLSQPSLELLPQRSPLNRSTDTLAHSTVVLTLQLIVQTGNECKLDLQNVQTCQLCALFHLRVIPRLGPLKFYVMNSSDLLYKVRLCLINVVEKDFTPIS